MKFLWTAIYVKDLDQSVAFYSELAALQVMRRFPAGPGIEIAMMGNGTGNETLVELIADKNKSTIDFGEFISIGFAVDSLDEMLQKVSSKNIAVHAGPFETPAMKYFCIKDPNGLNVQFFQQK